MAGALGTSGPAGGVDSGAGRRQQALDLLRLLRRGDLAEHLHALVGHLQPTGVGRAFLDRAAVGSDHRDHGAGVLLALSGGVPGDTGKAGQGRDGDHRAQQLLAARTGGRLVGDCRFAIAHIDGIEIGFEARFIAILV
jgi:hypothetical protein